VLYALANCLVQQAGDRDAKTLQEAIQLFEQCILDESASDLAADARHNLELAKMLWIKAQSHQDKNSNEKSSEDNSPPQAPEKKGGKDPDREADLTNGVPKNVGMKMTTQPKSGHEAQRTDEPPAPGKGNLPPVPDSQEPISMTPEDAAAHLQQATARI